MLSRIRKPKIRRDNRVLNERSFYVGVAKGIIGGDVNLEVKFVLFFSSC